MRPASCHAHRCLPCAQLPAMRPAYSLPFLVCSVTVQLPAMCTASCHAPSFLPCPQLTPSLSSCPLTCPASWHEHTRRCRPAAGMGRLRG
eukprot:120635-Chlamydomonas_euryale.AAC.1